MIGAFESMVRQYPERTFFTYVDAQGNESVMAYRETRVLAAALAKRLSDQGVKRGDCILVSLRPNTFFVPLVLAAIYGGNPLLLLDPALSESEKLSRMLEVERSLASRIAARVTEDNLSKLVSDAEAFLSGQYAGEFGPTVWDNAFPIEKSGRGPRAGQTGAIDPVSSEYAAAIGSGRNYSRAVQPGREMYSLRDFSGLDRMVMDEQWGHSGIAKPGRTRTPREALETEQLYSAANATLNTSVRNTIAESSKRSARGLGRADSARRRNEMARQEAFDTTMHVAERATRLYDPHATAIIVFSSGKHGRPKAAALSWSNLIAEAKASNARLNKPAIGVWQSVLPLHTVSGFQVIVRSVLNKMPFKLYQRFNASLILRDAEKSNATHIAVTQAMLAELCSVPESKYLSGYDCVLLGGRNLNSSVVETAFLLGARICLAYSKTESSGQIANAFLDETYCGGLKLFPNYEAYVVDPDSRGFGALALKGPGVCRDYLNARAPRTVDGYLLTGDVAAIHNGHVFFPNKLI